MGWRGRVVYLAINVELAIGALARKLEVAINVEVAVVISRQPWGDARRSHCRLTAAA